jgi:signal transduction histidine kinase
LFNSKHPFRFLKKKKQADELIAIKAELNTAQAKLHLYAREIKTILFQVNHQLRQPITSLLGLAALLEQPNLTGTELKKNNNLHQNLCSHS